jgi:hypothetical protein
MKIALLANLKEDAHASPEDPPGRWDDLDDLLTVETTLRSLTDLGHAARYFPGVFNSIEEIKAFKPDLCFNTSEGHYGDSREAQIPAVLDMLSIPYTAAGVLGMMLSHNKHIAKNQFLQAGLPTAKFMVVDDPKNIPESSLRYPMFVKPAFEGSSNGIPESARVNNYNELVQQINWLVEPCTPWYWWKNILRAANSPSASSAMKLCPWWNFFHQAVLFTLTQRTEPKRILSRVSRQDYLYADQGISANRSTSQKSAIS